MLSPARLALAVVASLLLIGLVALGWLDRGASSPSALATEIARLDCRSCHAEVAQEWDRSRHAQSWTGLEVQAAFKHFGNDRKCHTCHAPEPVFAVGLERPVELRATGLDSGVDCMSCHLLPGGQGVAAARTISSAPCRPIATAALSTSQACAGCHTASHRDWSESRYAAEGKTCQSCHMPPSESRPGGKSHLCLGGHDDALVRSGVSLTSRQDGGELLVEVTNHRTGHNFPGERHNRLLILQVIERKADGATTLARRELIKGITPFRGETSAEKIRAGETFAARFPIVEPPVTAEVQLLYKRYPYHADRQALVVHEARVELEAP